MAFPRLDIVDPISTTTIYWSLNDHTGAANPGNVRSKLGPVKLGTNSEISTFEFPGLAGGDVVFHRDTIWNSSATIYTIAPSDDDHALGLGSLVALLGRDGVMVFQRSATSAEQFIDYLPSPRLSLLRGQHLPDLARDADGLTFEFLMQPYLRDPEITVGPVTIVNDPTLANGRSYSIDIEGDLPTPVKVKGIPNTGAKIKEVRCGTHIIAGNRRAEDLAAYHAGTKHMQCEATGNGWTITLGTDTAAANDGTNASPVSVNNVARCTYATTSTMARRIRGVRTTELDSLRGAWDVWVRCKASAVSKHILQLRWGPGTADPPAYSNTEVPHEVAAGTIAFGYAEVYLGQIYLPDEVTLSGLTLEIHTRRESGTGNLDMDHTWHLSRDGLGTVLVPAGGSEESWIAGDLNTPVANPAGGTAANNEIAILECNDSTNNAGVPPNTGQVLVAGRYRTTWKARNPFEAARTMRIVVRNITDSTDTLSETVTVPKLSTKEFTRSWDAVAGKAYQEQYDDPQNGQLDWYGIIRFHVAAIGSGEAFRTDPGARYTVDRLDTSGNLAGQLQSTGEVPVIMYPGVNILSMRADELSLSGYSENENKRDRTMEVTFTYSPRRGV